MPLTPAEAHAARIHQATKIIEDVEREIDRALKTSSPDHDGGWEFPCLRGNVFWPADGAVVSIEIAHEIATHYRQRGWDAAVHHLVTSEFTTYKVRIQRPRAASNEKD